MTIRARLTLWYAGLLLIGFALVAGWAYYEMAVEHPVMKQALAAEGHTPLEELGEVLLFGALPAFLLALVGGWFLMRRALAPVTRLTQAVERIHAGNLGQQLPRSGSGDELDRLTEVFNAMTRRLDDAFQRVREFTLHASHELKTPLSLMLSELETGLRDGPLSAPERARAASLIEEIERLTQIVDGLTFLSKADAGMLQFEKSPVRLDELAAEAFADAEVLAQPHRLNLRLGAPGPVTVLGDRRRLRQLLLILTDNAIKYNQPGGRVALTLCAQDGRAALTLANTGPGIAPDRIGRVFDRFFRGDPSHSRDIEGCGLGLTIAQRIVRAHHGEIHITSEPGRLTTVTVALPAIAETSRPEKQPAFAAKG